MKQVVCEIQDAPDLGRREVSLGTQEPPSLPGSRVLPL